MALIGEMKYLQIGGNTYEIPTSELPIASSSTLGGIKVGTNLSIDSSTGVLSASFTETDPVFSASAAAGITATDITNWDNKVSDDHKWNDVTLNKSASAGYSGYVPFLASTSETTANLRAMSDSPSSGRIAVYNSGNYLISTTPTSGDNSTKVATTAYVDAAIPTISITRNLTSGTKSATINIDGTDYDIYSETNTDTKVKTTKLTPDNQYHGIVFGSTTAATEEKYISSSLLFGIGSGGASLTIGNNYGTDKANGTLELVNGSYFISLVPANLSANCTIYLPNANGTLALTSNIPSAYTSTPSAPGTGSAGSSTSYSKGDHVHPKELPTVSSSDNDKVLMVSNGTWVAGAFSGLPSVSSSDNGKVLTVVSGAWAAASLPIYDGGVS